MLFSPFAFASGEEEEREGDSTEAAAAPDAVRQTVAREFPRAQIVSSAIERHENGDAWHVRVQERLTSRELVMDPGGAVVAQAQDVQVAAAPSHIRQAVARPFGFPSVWHVRHFSGAGEEAWLVTFSHGERSGQPLFDAEGRLVHGQLGPPPKADGRESRHG
jgi:hypothetical protein